MTKNIICMRNRVLRCVEFKDIQAGDVVYRNDVPITVGVGAHCSGDRDSDGWLAHCMEGGDIHPEALDHEEGEITRDILCMRDGESIHLHFRELRAGDIVYMKGKPVHIDEDAHHSPGDDDYNRWLAYGEGKEHILPEDLDCIII